RGEWRLGLSDILLNIYIVVNKSINTLQYKSHHELNR
ncbi:unnamed protein product, partial [marine sediment metagenome]